MMRGSYKSARRLILTALGDYKPKSGREVAEVTGLSGSSPCCSLFYCWRSCLVLTTKKPIYGSERIFKGRGGVTQNTGPWHRARSFPKESAPRKELFCSSVFEKR